MKYLFSVFFTISLVSSANASEDEKGNLRKLVSPPIIDPPNPLPLPDPNPKSCGGYFGKGCGANMKCIDDPNDQCDPDAGYADCPGICVSSESCPAGEGVKYFSQSFPSCKRSRFGCPGQDRFDLEGCGCGCKPTAELMPPTSPPNEDMIDPDFGVCPDGDIFEYKSRSSLECTRLKFACEDNSVSFQFDGCGCGCIKTAPLIPTAPPTEDLMKPDVDTVCPDGKDVSYHSRSASECKLLKFGCRGDFSRFDVKGCGCGCLPVVAAIDQPKSKQTRPKKPIKKRTTKCMTKKCVAKRCRKKCKRKCRRSRRCKRRCKRDCKAEAYDYDYDSIDASSSTNWSKLVGKTCEEAMDAIIKSMPQLSVVECIPKGSLVSADYRENRVRIFTDENAIVARVPIIG